MLVCIKWVRVLCPISTKCCCSTKNVVAAPKCCCKYDRLQHNLLQISWSATTFSCCNNIFMLQHFFFACSNISLLKQHFILLQQHNYWYNKLLATTKYIVTTHNVVATQIMLSQHWNVVANQKICCNAQWHILLYQHSTCVTAFPIWYNMRHSSACCSKFDCWCVERQTLLRDPLCCCCMLGHCPDGRKPS